MLIAESQSTFRDFLAQRDKDPTRLLPEELLTLGFAFYESTRATDALPADDASFGDALLFQWGTREALVGPTMASATTSTLPASSSRRLAKTTTQCFNSPASCNTSSPPTFAQLRRAISGAVASKPYLSSKSSPWAILPSRRSRDGLPERSSSTSPAYDGYPSSSLSAYSNRRRASRPAIRRQSLLRRSEPFLAQGRPKTCSFTPDQSRWPTNAHEHPVGPAYPDLIETPFAMTQRSAGADDQVVHPRGDGIDVGRADENAKGIVILWHPPRACSCLGEVYLTAPPSHDDVIAVSARAREAKTFPERDGSF
jgi:hypothetical protein